MTAPPDSSRAAAAPVLVIGAGAAGLVAAIFARSAGRPVVVVDGTTDGGRKILISGGGRCNVLPEALEPERFVTSSSPVTLRRMLRSWPLREQIAFFEGALGVPLAFEAESHKYFPRSNRARDVRDALVARARRDGVLFRFSARVTAVARTDAGWRVETTAGAIDASAVIVATGGLSVPATGSDGLGFTIARRCGHTIHETFPALAPLTLDPPRHAALSGLSLDVRIRARAGDRLTESTGGFLFTHRGYSGPAVLDISHVAARRGRSREPVSIRVQWSTRTADQWARGLHTSRGSLLNAVAEALPERLAEVLIRESGIPGGRRAAELKRTERHALVERLTAYPLEWSGDEGYRKAEVTGGGVSLDEIDPATGESRLAPGLYFCGEVLDAFGPIGGHNFAWAWATGRLAGLAASGAHARR